MMFNKMYQSLFWLYYIYICFGHNKYNEYLLYSVNVLLKCLILICLSCNMYVLVQLVFIIWYEINLYSVIYESFSNGIEPQNIQVNEIQN